MTDIMKAANLVESLREITGLVKRFPAGLVVWHRGSGARMVVDGWKLAGDGKGLVSATTGHGGGNFYDFELSREPIVEPGSGDEWKQQSVTE